ncbi:hypothetical protein ACFL0P_02655 [Candidatus Omnitrophota bacterium]
MCFLIFSGIIALFFGFLLLILPKESFDKINTKANKLIKDLDSLAYKYKQGIGICLLLSGLTLLFVAYYLYKT